MFELDGNQYSTEDLQKAAKRYNMEYDTYLKVMIDKGLKEISPAKTIDPASADPTVVSSNNTGSTGDQDSSGSAKYNAYKIGGAEVSEIEFEGSVYADRPMLKEDMWEIDGTKYYTSELESSMGDVDKYVSRLRRSRKHKIKFHKFEEINREGIATGNYIDANNNGIKDEGEANTNVVNELDEVVVKAERPDIIEYDNSQGGTSYISKENLESLEQDIKDVDIATNLITDEELLDESVNKYFDLENLDNRNKTKKYGSAYDKDLTFIPVYETDEDYNDYLKERMGDRYEDYLEYKEDPAEFGKKLLASGDRSVNDAKDKLKQGNAERAMRNYSEERQDDMKALINYNTPFKTPEQQKVFWEREKASLDNQIQLIDSGKFKVQELDNQFLITERRQDIENRFNQLQDKYYYGIDENSSPDDIAKYNRLVEEYEVLQEEMAESGILEAADKVNRFQDQFQENLKNFAKKSEDINNLNIAKSALDMDYRNSTRVLASFENLIGGGVEGLIGGLGDIAYNIGSSNYISLTLSKNTRLGLMKGKGLSDWALDSAEERSAKLARLLPKATTFSDVDKGASYGDLILETFSDNAASTAMSLLPVGAGFAAGRGLTGVAAITARKLAVRQAGNLTSSAFFVSAFGNKYNEVGVLQREAYANIDKLKKRLLMGDLGTVEKRSLQMQIDRYQNAIDTSTAAKAFSAFTHGVIEFGAEKLGSLKFIESLQDISSLIGINAFKAAYRVGRKTAKGILIENTEEVITQLGQNGVDIVVLGENKSLIDGINPEFFLGTTLSALAISGPSMGQNLYNIVADQVKTTQEVKATRKLVSEYNQLQSDKLNFKTNSAGRRKILKRQKEILKEAGYQKALSISKLNALDAKGIEDLFQANTNIKQQQKVLKEAADSGLKRNNPIVIAALDKIEKLNEYRTKLLNTNETQINEYLEGFYETNPADGSKGQKFASTGKGFSELLYLETYARFQDQLLRLNVKKGTQIYQATTIEELQKQIDKLPEDRQKEIIEIWEVGEIGAVSNGAIIINNYLRTNNIAMAALLDVKGGRFAAVVATHELLHLRTQEAGLLKDNDIKLNFKGAVEGLKTILAEKLETSDITEEDYNALIERIDSYDNDKRVKNPVEEIINLYHDAVELGIVDLPGLSASFGIKSLLNSLGSKFMGESWQFNEFNTAEDVLNYLKRFNQDVRAARLKVGVDEPEKGSTSFSMDARQDLKWKNTDGDLSATFKVGERTFTTSLIETAFMEFDEGQTYQDIEDIAKELGITEDKDGDEIESSERYFHYEFGDIELGKDITGTGNAMEVFSVAINGVADYINKKKKIEGVIFTAKEPSRIRLYKTLGQALADKIGGSFGYQNDTFIVTKKPATTGGVKFSKSVNAKATLNNISFDKLKAGEAQTAIGTELPGMIKAQIIGRFNISNQAAREFTDDVVEKIYLAQETTKWNGKGDLYGFLNGRIALRIKDVVREEYKRNPEERRYLAGIDTNQFETLEKAANVVAEETVIKEDNKPVFKKLISSKVISTEALVNIKNKVLSTVRTLKTAIDSNTSINKTVSPLIAEIKKEMGKQADIDLKKEMGGKKDDQLKKFLLSGKKAILQNMTTTWLMGAMPGAVQKRVDGTWTSNWKGKKIDRESVKDNNAGRTSGADMVRRDPNVTSMSDAEFLGYILDSKGDPIRGRKESLAKAMAEEISLEVFNQQLRDENTDISKAFEQNQTLKGVVLAENYIAEVTKQIERGNVKFSLSAMTPDMRYNFLAGTEMFHERIMNLEKINKPNIKKIFLATYNSNDFSPAVIDGIAAQFAKRLGPVSKAREMVSIPEFKQILIQISNQTDETLALQKLVGAAMNATEVFADEDNIIISRGAVIENMQMLIDDLGVDEGLQLIIAFGSSTFSSQGAIGLLKFDLKLQKLVRGLRADGRPITKAGADLFSGSEDLLQSLYNTLDLGGKRIERIENKEIFFSDGTAVARKYSPVTSVTQGMLKEGYVPDAVNYKAAQKFVTSFFENFAKQDLDPNVALTLLSTFNNGTSNALRAAARVWGKSTTMPYKTIKVNGKRVYIYEHAIPARVVLAYLYEYHVNGNKDINIEALWDDYRVTIIPIEEMDNVLTNAGFSSITTSDYVPGKSPWYNRYYNLFTRGRMPYAMVSYDGKETVGKAYEQYFNEKGKKPLIKANATQELSAIKIQQKAINKGRSAKFSKSPKKIRVFDFDDTLAKTKSSVLYVKPNPNVGFSPESVKQKAIFMVGGPGAGKTNVGKGLKLGRQGYKVVNQDIALEAMKKESGLPGNEANYDAEQRSLRSKLGAAAKKAAVDKFDKYAKNGDGMVIDGTGASYNATMKKVKQLEDSGYEVHMVIANTPLETSLVRNKARDERSLASFIVEKTWKQVQESSELYRKDFGDRLYEIDTESLGFGEALPDSFLQTVYEGINKNIAGKVDAATFAKEAGNMEAEGAQWNFSEFSKVMDGEKGPLFEVAKIIADKRGTKDVFVLTARPQDAALPIKQFLSSLGLNIPIKNITGLGDGAPKAKADWMISKVAEGYNDFYFADDHTGNVKAVKDILDTFDVKGKVQQAKVKFSKSLDPEFNLMIERSKGVESVKEFSSIVAKRRGANIGKYKFLVSSADDFRGLTSYTFAGKGKQGEADQKFFEDALLTPYFQGVNAIASERQTVKNDFRALSRMFKPTVKKLGKLIPDKDFTYDQAIRVYLWTKAGIEVPGISKRDQAKLNKLVEGDPSLVAFADAALLASKKDTWIEPGEYWDTKTMLSDLNDLTEKENRKEYLAEFIENVDIIFSEKNLNKVEAVYGTRHREALEDAIYSMKNGTNRTSGSNKITNKWNNWVNNSIGAIMFFNRRSATMQLLSTVNFINWSDNNPIKAAMAFANQPQYWKDFAMIFNSDKLKQRRGGLKSDIQEAEIANAAKGAKNKPQAILSYMLKIGFTPTQIADSFAISMGGASMYRNRIETYKKQGFDQKLAEEKAWLDFTKLSDETQQSGDPALVSQQQRSVAGRLILSFQNTTMQYTRLMKKAGQDLVNRRGDPKTNISKIIYYGAVQNFIFNALSTSLFALIPGFDDDDDDDETKQKKEDTKVAKILNSMMDSLLRGTGIQGAVLVAIKNTINKYYSEEEKGFTANHAYTLIEAANLSPAIGSKLRKLHTAIQTNKFEKDVIEKRGWDVTIDGKFNLSPKYSIVGDLAAATLNLPLDRAIQEVQGVAEALDDRNTKWQRIAMAMGWRTWNVGAENEEHDLIKADAGVIRQKEGKEKAKETRAKNKEIEKQRVANLSLEEKAAERAKKKEKQRLINKKRRDLKKLQ